MLDEQRHQLYDTGEISAYGIYQNRSEYEIKLWEENRMRFYGVDQNLLDSVVREIKKG